MNQILLIKSVIVDSGASITKSGRRKDVKKSVFICLRKKEVEGWQDGRKGVGGQHLAPIVTPSTVKALNDRPRSD